MTTEHSKAASVPKGEAAAASRLVLALPWLVLALSLLMTLVLLWRFTFKTLPPFIQELDRAQSWSAPAAGILSSLLISYLALVMQRTRTKLKHLEQEQRKFVALTTYSPDLIGINLSPLYVNEAGMRLGGVDSLDEALRFGVLDAFYPEDHDFMTREFLPKILREGHDLLEIRLRNVKTGEPIWMSMVVFQIKDDEGEPVALAVVGRDISARKQAEDELRKAHDELEQNVVERTGYLSLTIADLQDEIEHRITAEAALEQSSRRIEKLNRLYRTLSETSKAIARLPDRDELFREICKIAVERGGFLLAWIGLTDDDSGQVKPVASFGKCTGYLANIRITVHAEPEGMGPAGRAIRQGGHVICNDFLTDPGTGPWRTEANKWGLCSAASLAISLHGAIIGALTLYAGVRDYFDPHIMELLIQMQMDIAFALDNQDREARRRKMEDALRQETAEHLRSLENLREQEQMLIQQNRLAAMGEMISNIAHQWRQPLNALGLAIQGLPLACERGTFSKELLDDRVALAMRLIDHMSRTIDDFRNFFRPDKQKELFQVSRVINTALSLIEGNFRSRRIRVEVDIGADPVITGFPNEFSQVILNILCNSRDAFVVHSSEDPVITIAVKEEAGRAVVIIRDNAGGIPREILGKIFEPYFTTKGPAQGTGIGLFMAKNIIETNMGGRLTAGNVDDGAEFRIEV